MLLPGLMIAVLTPGFAADENMKKIVGVWAVVDDKGKATGVTMEFTADGESKPSNGANGTYKVEQGKLMITTSALGGKEQTATRTIKKLTNDSLVLAWEETAAVISTQPNGMLKIESKKQMKEQRYIKKKK